MFFFPDDDDVLQHGFRHGERIERRKINFKNVNYLHECHFIERVLEFYHQLNKSDY